MKARILIVGFFMIALASFSFAQDDGTDENWFVKNVPLERISIHSLGYRSEFFTNDLRRVAVYMPNRWFTAAAGQGEIVYSEHASAPYMEVYYLNGEFSYVRLVVQRDFAHPTWEVLPNTPEMTANFESVDSFPSPF